jgi:hypothetical protein
MEPTKPIMMGLRGVHSSSPDNDMEIQRDTLLRYAQAYENELIRKVDRRLLPILGALYAISLIDRVNVCS